MATVRSQRVGRRNNVERIRELVSLLGSLSRTGDSISLEAISTRLGLSLDEARTMMDIMCQASGEEIGGLLISCNDEETEFTLQYPATTGRPVRLTDAETIAVNHALDVAGIAEDDPLRKRLESSLLSPAIRADDVRRALGAQSPYHAQMLLCARSQVEQRVIHFWYKGLRDAEPRQRHAVVRSLATRDGAWYAKTTDVVLREERTFRCDRMNDIVLGEIARNQEEMTQTPTRRVPITFLDRSFFEMMDWPELHVFSDDGRIIHGDISYYGERSTWLIRRICAGNGGIIVEDDELVQHAATWAAQQLEQCKTQIDNS